MAAELFVDPRLHPDLPSPRPSPRITDDPEELHDLHRLCEEGRVYQVESWIQAGGPLQVARGTRVRQSRSRSALTIGLDDGNQALVLLLLCNGYDPNLETDSPLNQALRSRRWDILDLLLESRADPGNVDLQDLFGTYQTDLFERFYRYGVDVTEAHELAEALAHHTSNRPLFGFARRHRESDPRIQRDLDMALAHHAHEGNGKGVALCLWAGGAPHTPAPVLRYRQWWDEEEGQEPLGHSAIQEASAAGHADILYCLGPDPALDDFQELYEDVDSRAVIELLARHTLPENVAAVVSRHVWRLSTSRYQWSGLDSLKGLFEAGVRWRSWAPDQIADLRRLVLKLSDDAFVDLLKLLAWKDYCSADILEELARTPAMRRRMKEVGFIPCGTERRGRRPVSRPTRSREVLKRCGIDLPKPPRRIPHTVYIGSGRTVNAGRKCPTRGG